MFHRGDVFVDGAVMNNLPTDIMRAQAVGEIVAVDISADDVLRTDVEEYALPSFWKLLVERMYRPRRPGKPHRLDDVPAQAANRGWD